MFGSFFVQLPELPRPKEAATRPLSGNGLQRDWKLESVGNSTVLLTWEQPALGARS